MWNRPCITGEREIEVIVYIYSRSIFTLEDKEGVWFHSSTIWPVDAQKKIISFFLSSWRSRHEMMLLSLISVEFITVNKCPDPWSLIGTNCLISSFCLKFVCIPSGVLVDHWTIWQSWPGSWNLGLNFDYSACCCQKQKLSGKLLSEPLFWFMHLVCCYLLSLGQTANFHSNCVWVSVCLKPEAE